MDTVHFNPLSFFKEFLVSISIIFFLRKNHFQLSNTTVTFPFHSQEDKHISFSTYLASGELVQIWFLDY